MGRNELFRKEEVLKEEVYGEIDKRISDASIGVRRHIVGGANRALF